MSVSTVPGAGYPRDFERKGGGFDEEGRPLRGRLTTRVDCGDDFQFNHDQVLRACAIDDNGVACWGERWVWAIDGSSGSDLSSSCWNRHQTG